MSTFSLSNDTSVKYNKISNSNSLYHFYESDPNTNSYNIIHNIEMLKNKKHSSHNKLQFILNKPIHKPHLQINDINSQPNTLVYGEEIPIVKNQFNSKDENIKDNGDINDDKNIQDQDVEDQVYVENDSVTDHYVDFHPDKDDLYKDVDYIDEDVDYVDEDVDYVDEDVDYIDEDVDEDDVDEDIVEGENKENNID